MKGFITALACICLVLGAQPVSYAQEDLHYQAAEELLVTSRTEASLKQSIEQMVDMDLQASPHLTPYRSTMLEFFEKYMSWESLKDDLIKIYMEEFTESELRELTAFYNTPIGQKSLEKLPILMQKGAQLGVQRVQANITELQQMIAEKAQELSAQQQ